MLTAALRIKSGAGDRRVRIDKLRFRIGRGPDADLVFQSREISRHHAVVALEDGHFVLRDESSKLGTYVNGKPILAQHQLAHGDQIHLGGEGGVDLAFERGSVSTTIDRAPASTASAIVDLGHVAALLGGLRALGAGRVLDDVLALVLDAALAVGDADRAFIMLANPEGELEFRLARGRGGEALPNTDFRSRRVPAEVFDSGRSQYFEDFTNEVPNPDGRTSVTLQLRSVFCLPLVAFDLVDDANDLARDRRIGVLYLDSQRKRRLVSAATKSALEALATNAAIAIENARLYREAAEKARLEDEMRLAAEIQRLLLPRASHASAYCEAVGLSIPCRSIGGDFFDYAGLRDGRFAFAVGDVAGKGAPAALLSTLVLGVLADQRRDMLSPAEAVTRLNEALAQRAIEARYVTLVCGQLTPDGRLTYCNAGHIPPLVVGERGVRWLEVGGPPAGMFEEARFDEESLTLTPSDRLIVCTDGVSEARSAAGDEFGGQRLVEAAQCSRGMDAAQLVETIVRDVRAFSSGAPQGDDVTALVVAYLGEG